MRTAAFTTVVAFTALFAGIAVRAEPTTAPAAATTQPEATIEITVDTTAAPEMADFAARCKAEGEKYYPTISKLLPQDGYTPPAKVVLRFKHMDGVAYTSSDGITCSAEYFAKHTDDVGAVIHELAHVVQHYTLGKRPGWLVEGIADWVRWFNYEPKNKQPRPTQPRADYDASYQTTAAFLQWCQDRYDPKLVAELDEACRKAHYKPDLWTQYTGKSVEDLGAEWKATLPMGKPRPTTKPAAKPAK